VEAKFGVSLVNESRALFGESSRRVRVACAISKRYKGRTYPYWYAYHPRWDDYLKEVETGLLVLGCLDLNYGFAIPRSIVQSVLDDLYTTGRPDGERYWHISLVEKDGDYSLLLPRRSDALPLTQYIVRP
jgi:hypothetical protein